MYTIELYHHGIQGQKWGVRRFQNADGTLTAAGRKRKAKEYTRQLNKAAEDVVDQRASEKFWRNKLNIETDDEGREHIIVKDDNEDKMATYYLAARQARMDGEEIADNMMNTILKQGYTVRELSPSDPVARANAFAGASLAAGILTAVGTTILTGGAGTGVGTATGATVSAIGMGTKQAVDDKFNGMSKEERQRRRFKVKA